MFLGKVIGSVWSTVKWPQVEGLKLLLVRPYGARDLGLPSVAEPPTDLENADAVVCADTLDAGPGDEVVIAYGHAARVAVAESLGEHDRPPFPIDAAVVMIVDGKEVARG
jgi:ethanolamine utilization protein EutN